MATFDDFHQGDRVRHAEIGPGVVIAVHDGLVEVAYDQTYQDRRGVRKQHSGKYDRDWFRICGDLLAQEPR